MDITRQQQLLENIQRIVSIELRELNHELFHDVVVTHVHLSNDGRECRVFVAAPEESIEKLNTEFWREIQRRFTKKYVRKIVPKLIFCNDSGEQERIEAILAEQEKASDE